MKKLISVVLFVIIVFIITGCQDTKEPSLFSIAESLSVVEFSINDIVHYNNERIENLYIITYENGDILSVAEDNSLEYHMDFSSDDYTASRILAFGVYGEMDSSTLQIVLSIGTLPSTGIVESFDFTLERTEFDITFDKYINSADILETTSRELINTHGLDFITRFKTAFETTFQVELY